MNQLFKTKSQNQINRIVNKSEKECFHCGELIPNSFSETVTIHGKPQKMCCSGCVAVAQTIIDAGLGEFYAYRTKKSALGDAEIQSFLEKSSLYQDPELETKFVSQLDEANAKALLTLSGVSCAACIWLIEKKLLTMPGVKSASLNFATSVLAVKWNKSETNLSEILATLAHIGYIATPINSKAESVLNQKRRKTYLRQIGIATAFAMQVMILSVALYVGEYRGMDPVTEKIFIYLSMLLTLPVFFYSGYGILNSFIKDLRYHRITVNIPIGLGLVLAFTSSIFSAFTGYGQVYFDSVVMFISLLLAARFLEFSARIKAQRMIEPLLSPQPEFACKLINGKEKKISASELLPGDSIMIRSGEKIVADGVITVGKTEVDESIITGESKALNKLEGDKVYSGSINYGNTITVKVQEVGENTKRSLIASLAEKAQAHKPEWLKVIDKIASKFVITVLSIAIVTMIYWLYQGSDNWLAITISVLIITCPCALSLATPLAMSLALGRLTRSGILIANAKVLETVSKISGIIYDKTGTLTYGKFQIANIITNTDLDETECLSIAKSLEFYSNHPIAEVFKNVMQVSSLEVTDCHVITGFGIHGKINGDTYYIGSEKFINEYTKVKLNKKIDLEAHTSHIYLATAKQLISIFELQDSLRPEAQQLVDLLSARGYKQIILSGDNQEAVSSIARQLGVSEFYGRQTPDSKLDFIKNKQTNNESWIMIGDGVNDAPVLKAAAISIAPHLAQDYATANADVVLLDNDLSKVSEFIDIALQTKMIIKQNIMWALFYNLTVVPLAVTGFVMPWIAASGMAFSSLLVTLNSLRLNNYKIK